MLNIKRILFPTDFSEGARRAFPQAAYLANWHDAELHIVNVAKQSGSEDDTEGRLPLSVETLTDWLPSSPGGDGRPNLKAMPITQKQLTGASPAERLIAYSEDENIDLIAMGTHGRRGVNRMLFGSVTEEVVRQAPCPLLTVRSDTEVSPENAIRRILVPIDFSEASELALEYAKEIALTYGAELDLMHVVEEVVYPSTYGLQPASFPTLEVVERVEENLADIAREDIGYEHVMVNATVGHPPTAILDYVEENEIDLVVISTRGRTGLDRLLVGSVAERVIRQSPTPVFVVKPGRKSLLAESQAQAETAGE